MHTLPSRQHLKQKRKPRIGVQTTPGDDLLASMMKIKSHLGQGSTWSPRGTGVGHFGGQRSTSGVAL